MECIIQSRLQTISLSIIVEMKSKQGQRNSGAKDQISNLSLRLLETVPDKAFSIEYKRSQKAINE